MKKESQEKQIINYLRKGNKLTSLEALTMFGCLRLSGRIHRLRNQGYFIMTNIIKTNSGKRIAEYELITK